MTKAYETSRDSGINLSKLGGARSAVAGAMLAFGGADLARADTAPSVVAEGATPMLVVPGVETADGICVDLDPSTPESEDMNRSLSSTEGSVVNEDVVCGTDFHAPAYDADGNLVSTAANLNALTYHETYPATGTPLTLALHGNDFYVTKDNPHENTAEIWKMTLGENPEWSPTFAIEPWVDAGALTYIGLTFVGQTGVLSDLTIETSSPPTTSPKLGGVFTGIPKEDGHHYGTHMYGPNRTHPMYWESVRYPDRSGIRDAVRLCATYIPPYATMPAEGTLPLRPCVPVEY